MKHDKNKTCIIIALFILGLGFLYILYKVISKESGAFDEAIYGIFTRRESLTNAMKAITTMGEAGTLIFLSIIGLIVFKNKLIGLTIPLNLFLIGLINSILKEIVKRPRPIGINLITVGGYSFPSGHSASSLAFYGFLMYLVYKYVKNKKIKIFSMVTLGLLIIAIGTSRVYLGVHFASDVLGGFFLSGIYLILYIVAVTPFIESARNRK